MLASVFARYGDLTSSAGLLAGIGPALWWGAALAAAAVPVALALPAEGARAVADDRRAEVIEAA